MLENLTIFPNAQAAVTKIADDMLALSKQGRVVHISLSGGSTPKLLFKTLAQAPYKDSIQWQNLHFWWGDERFVAVESTESNYGEAKRLLFDFVPQANVHPINGTADHAAEQARYQAEIEQTVPNAIFDWIILGMGDDGHTASLFPQQTDLAYNHLTTLAQHPQTGQWRLSKTAKLLGQAQRLTYLVTGEAKAKVLEQIANNAPAALAYPAAQIHAHHGRTEWYLDQAAARYLTQH